MTQTPDNSRIAGLKAEAHALRAECAEKGEPITHSAALERIARSYGARDWNTLSARVRRQSNELILHTGERVRGTYLGQPFTGYVHAVHYTSGSDFYRVTLHFDAAVDLVRFDSFSAFRQRVSATIDKFGRSPYRITGGAPQIAITRDESEPAL